MRFEYIEPIVASTKKVLASIMDAEFAADDISLVNADSIEGDVSILILVKGESGGCLIVNMDRATATRVCAVMNGASCDVSSPLEMDAIAELSNMIVGNAISALNDLGYDFSIFLPPSLIDRNELARRTAGLDLFRVSIGTPCGEISINVALKTNWI